jgi:hypothetical protein
MAIVSHLHFSLVSLVLIPAHCAGGGGPYPHRLSLVLVAAQ